MAYATKWCRDPPLRSRLLRLLLHPTVRNEAVFSSFTWGSALSTLRDIEEAGISPPPSRASDIPLHNRLRLHSVAIDWNISMTRINYLRYPYTDGVEAESAWMAYQGGQCVHLSFDVPVRTTRAFFPDTIAGAGFFKFRDGRDGDEYTTIRSEGFCFLLPAM